MIKHTPGPWNADEWGTKVWDTHGIRLATVHGGNKPDAKLIAAAPDMAAALALVLFGLTDDADNNDGNVNRYALAEIVKTTLAKAGGAV